jgi:hypothetical protein
MAIVLHYYIQGLQSAGEYEDILLWEGKQKWNDIRHNFVLMENLWKD